MTHTPPLSKHQPWREDTLTRERLELCLSWGAPHRHPSGEDRQPRDVREPVSLSFLTCRKVCSSSASSRYSAIRHLHEHTRGRCQTGPAPALAGAEPLWKEAGLSGTCPRGGTPRQTLLLPKTAWCNVSFPLSSIRGLKPRNGQHRVLAVVWTVGETTPTVCSSPACAPRGTRRYVHSCSGVLPGQGLAVEGLPAHYLLGSRSHILSQCLGESSEKKGGRSEALAVVKSTRLRTSWDSRATPCHYMAWRGFLPSLTSVSSPVRGK